MASEITEEEEKETSCFINPEARKERIRRIIQHQKSLYWSSSSSSSLSASVASFTSSSSSHESSSLLELMRGGSTSLRRLFDMEHTSLANHFENYSGSPMIKPILLWGSDTDEEAKDPWASIRSVGNNSDLGSDGPKRFASDDDRIRDSEFGFYDIRVTTRGRKLTRKKSFRRLPGFGFWRYRRRFRFKLRLRRLRIMICGRIF